MFRQRGGDDVGLIVAAGDLSLPVKRDGDEYVGGIENAAGGIVFDELGGEALGDGPAAVVFEMMNHVAERAFKFAEAGDICEGVDAAASAPRARGAVGDNRQGAAGAGGVGGEILHAGEATQAEPVAGLAGVVTGGAASGVEEVGEVAE